MFKFKRQIKHKGRKLYGVSRNEKDAGVVCVHDNIGGAKRALDSTFTVLVEMTITRVFTREQDLKEIELDL
jgi:hypothetical protein